ncbi:hypothetical protein VP01_484g2 [Puccinia sorghi]|uniref:No apical meristem-associated C-terminal domain-containing protein n=1 Tax=Puccinia sorghi TaxID=27349 RepID=A0A0L6UMD8_9BASI|nr:hypothetical protein VP01_484g2 [Puccinia sorghi]
MATINPAMNVKKVEDIHTPTREPPKNNTNTEETLVQSKNKNKKSFSNLLKKSLENRWYHIQNQVSKYCGNYVQFERRMQSQCNNDEKVMEAKLLFKNDSVKNSSIFIIAGGSPPSTKVGKAARRCSRMWPRKVKGNQNNNDMKICDLIKSQQELLEVSCQKQKFFDSFLDNLVMSNDLSRMDEETLESFQAKQCKAMEQMKSKE